MIKFIVAAIAVVVAGASLWGWGWGVRHWTRARAFPHAVTIAVGLAAVLFLGGSLNLLRLAYPLAVDLVVLAGLALTLFAWLKSGKRRPALPSGAAIAAGIPVVVTTGFVAACLLPPAAFNIHDDLEKYFVYPIRMLATGTLQPNPLGSMGVDTLGGQAFLQAFVVAHFPLGCIGAMDNLFCLLLCVTLAGFAVKPGPGALGALLAELCVLAINPQLVNISAVFSGAALMMAAVFLTGQPGSPDEAQPPAPVLGLVYAGILALKSTLVIFVGLHFLATVATGLWLGRRCLPWALRTGLWTVLFIAPWLILHAPLYLAPPLPAVPLLPPEAATPLDLFSRQPLGYGATQLHFTGLALASLSLAGYVLLAMKRGWLRPSPPAAAIAAAGAVAGLGYLALVAGFGPLAFGQIAATRYACPILIAVVPAIIRLLETLQEERRGRMLPLGAACLGLATAIAFLPSAAARIAEIARNGVPLAYFDSHSREEKDLFVAYNRKVLYGPVHAKLVGLQALVPVGEPLAVWVMTPFWLDFRRNPIVHAEPAGLAMRWARLPPGIHYFLLEYRGFAVREDDEYVAQLTATGRVDRVIAARTLAFLRDLRWRARKSVIFHDDGSYVLMRFDEP